MTRGNRVHIKLLPIVAFYLAFKKSFYIAYSCYDFSKSLYKGDSIKITYEIKIDTDKKEGKSEKAKNVYFNLGELNEVTQ